MLVGLVVLGGDSRLASSARSPQRSLCKAVPMIRLSLSVGDLSSKIPGSGYQGVTTSTAVAVCRV